MNRMHFRQPLTFALAALFATLAGMLAIGKPKLLAEGDVELPAVEQSLISTQPITDTTPTAPVIHMAYFSKAGCPVCARVNDYLGELQSLYPQLVIAEFPIEEEESQAVSEWLGQRYGVPEEIRLSTPAVFVGEDYLVGRNQVTGKPATDAGQVRRQRRRADVGGL